MNILRVNSGFNEEYYDIQEFSSSPKKQNLPIKLKVSAQAKKIKSSFLKASQPWSKKIFKHKPTIFHLDKHVEYIAENEILFGYGKIKKSNKVKFYTIDTPLKKIDGYSSVLAEIKEEKEVETEKKAKHSTETIQNVFSDAIQCSLMQSMTFQITAILESDSHMVKRSHVSLNENVKKPDLVSQKVMKFNLQVLKISEFPKEERKGIELALNKINRHLSKTSFDFVFFQTTYFE